MSTDEIARYLQSLERHDHYCLDTVLKSSDFETTEIVRLRDESGTLSEPRIRKTILRESGLGSAYERIFAEQQSGKVFEHIPYLHECYAAGDVLVVIMDYLEGETLQDLVYRRDPSPKLAAELFGTICDAVDELHRLFDPPLIHRDLKPSNLIVSGQQVYIIDFGIARNFKDEAATDTMYFGTRAYAPPEQFGYGQTTVRSDIYALGMLLYYCLVEKTPDTRLVQTGFAETGIPQALRNVLVRATAFDPAERYVNVREMKQAFENALSELRIGAGEPTQPANKQLPPFTPGTSLPPTYNTQNYIPSDSGDYQHTKRLLHYLGIAWNALIILVLAFFLAACFDKAINGDPDTSVNPPWLDTLGYALLMPLLFVCASFSLFDKRRLRRRFPNTMGKVRTWHCWLASGAVFLAIILAVFLAKLIFA